MPRRITWTRRSVLASASLALLALADRRARAHTQIAGDVEIIHPWAAATPLSAKNGAAYLTLTNHGLDTERLLGIETPAAKHAEMHAQVLKDGVMTMEPLELVEIFPGAPVIFEPGGPHIMLFDLAAPLLEYTSFNMTLKFERAGWIDVMVEVERNDGNDDHSS